MKNKQLNLPGAGMPSRWQDTTHQATLSPMDKAIIDLKTQRACGVITQRQYEDEIIMVQSGGVFHRNCSH